MNGDSIIGRKTCILFSCHSFESTLSASHEPTLIFFVPLAILDSKTTHVRFNFEGDIQNSELPIQKASDTYYDWTYVINRMRDTYAEPNSRLEELQIKYRNWQEWTPNSREFVNEKTYRRKLNERMSQELDADNISFIQWDTYDWSVLIFLLAVPLSYYLLWFGYRYIFLYVIFGKNRFT